MFEETFPKYSYSRSYSLLLSLVFTETVQVVIMIHHSTVKKSQLREVDPLPKDTQRGSGRAGVQVWILNPGRLCTSRLGGTWPPRETECLLRDHTERKEQSRTRVRVWDAAPGSYPPNRYCNLEARWAKRKHEGSN